MAELVESPLEDRLRNLIARSGMSNAAVARMLGYKWASGLQRYLDPSDPPRKYLDTDMVESLIKILIGKGTPPITREEVVALGHPALLPPANAEMHDGAGGRPKPSHPVDLPLRGHIKAGNAAPWDFEFNGEEIGVVARPMVLIGNRDAFAAYVVGSSMEPAFVEGQKVYVQPGKPARVGDYVLVELHSDGGAPPAYIKRLYSRTDKRLVLEQFNPPRHDIVVELRRIRNVYRILPYDEILGT